MEIFTGVNCESLRLTDELEVDSEKAGLDHETMSAGPKPCELRGLLVWFCQ